MPEYNSQQLFDLVTNSDNPPNKRIAAITARIVADLFRAIDDLNVTTAEFFAASSYFSAVGSNGEMGLVTASLGFDRLMDILADETDRAAGTPHQGTPRAILGPLYIPDAPMCKGEARLDDGTLTGEWFAMSGRVIDREGKPLAGAIVDIWHASPTGGYSHFDPSLKEYNFRRRIETTSDGTYRFRSLMPSGYEVPTGSKTDYLLKALGRHGNRPAHVHFLVTAPGMEPLTTQINIPGDTYIDDDMAFATRDGLIVTLGKCDDPKEIERHGFDAPFVSTEFDFQMTADANRKTAAA